MNHIYTRTIFYATRSRKYILHYVFDYVDVYVTAKMDVLGKTVLPRQNGFAGRQNRSAWTDQAKCSWNYFRSYLFV